MTSGAQTGGGRPQLSRVILARIFNLMFDIPTFQRP